MHESSELITRRRSAGTYHEAMLSCPAARRIEFEYPVTLAQPRNGEVMVDFPSAGGYLGPYLHRLAPQAVYYAVEHTPEYEQAGLEVSAGTWQHLHFADRSVDIVLCLAALHHVFPGRELFYQECHRILRPGGRLIIGDVSEGSRADRFLAEFVDKYSPEGHVARFFRADVDVPEIESAGLRVSHWEVKDFSWYYPDRETAIHFCRGLFRLGEAPDEKIWEALNHYLGIEQTDAGIAMGWQLAFIRADV
jgi:SAM-dependent methyltransferase